MKDRTHELVEFVKSLIGEKVHYELDTLAREGKIRSTHKSKLLWADVDEEATMNCLRIKTEDMRENIHSSLPLESFEEIEALEDGYKIYRKHGYEAIIRKL